MVVQRENLSNVNTMVYAWQVSIVVEIHTRYLRSYSCMITIRPYMLLYSRCQAMKRLITSVRATTNMYVRTIKETYTV
jgi:hypothetical protein